MIRAAQLLPWSLITATALAAPLSAGAAPPGQAQLKAPAGDELFTPSNLIAWCIVPFDSEHRGPAARAAMLRELGFVKYAYDWRAEHLPSFDDELASLERHGIELTACWFPPALDEDAKKILETLARRGVRTQLWVALGDPAGNDQASKVAAAAAALRPIAEAAAAQGCSVGLYNHGGWFGEPENQLAIVEALALPNVGIVYNLHHGHAHLDRLPELLEKLTPHLYAINLNGMDRDGEARGRKILPVGRGELDLEVLRTIRDSGYRGPIGVLGHTQDDARLRLLDNLDGLAWLVRQLDGEPAGEPPALRTPEAP